MTMTVSQSKRMSMVSSTKPAGLSNNSFSSHAVVSGSRFLTNADAATAGGLLSQSTGPPASPTKLRGITETELKVWRKAAKGSMLSDYSFMDLSESIDYPFKSNESVWVLSGDDNWYLGRIAGRNIRIGQTRLSNQGFYYPVCYGKRMNLRKYCCPLNGDMKPDTKDFRDLLRKHGLLEDEDEDEDMSDTVDDDSDYMES